MSEIKDGGPAFPVPGKFYVERGHVELEGTTGLSLRDYFAAQAMQAIIAKSPFQAEPQSFEVHYKTAMGAYEYADMMLKVRDEFRGIEVEWVDKTGE